MIMVRGLAMLFLVACAGGEKGDACRTDAECGADLSCVSWSDFTGEEHRECGVACQSDDDCPEGEVCQFTADGPYEICGAE